jgi:hypothetical protein
MHSSAVAAADDMDTTSASAVTTDAEYSTDPAASGIGVDGSSGWTADPGNLENILLPGFLAATTLVDLGGHTSRNLSDNNDDDYDGEEEDRENRAADDNASALSSAHMSSNDNFWDNLLTESPDIVN